MASGIIEANRTGGTVKRMHCGWAAHAGGHRRRAGAARLHRPADRAGGPVRLLPGVLHGECDPAPDHRRARRALGGARASSSSPTRPTTSPTPRSTRPPRCARGASRPTDVERSSSASPRRGPAHHRRADRGEARAGDRLPGPVQRPVHRRRRAARRRRARRPSTTSPTSWPGTRARLALMAQVDVVADDECDAIFPHQFPAVLTRPHRRRPDLVEEVLTNRGGPDRPLSRRRAAHEVPGQRRRPCSPADAAARTSQRARACATSTALDRLATADRTGRHRRRLALHRSRRERQEAPMSELRPGRQERPRRPARHGAEPRALDIGVSDGKIAALDAGHRRRRRRRRSSTAAASWPSPASSTPTSTGASTTRSTRTPAPRAAPRAGRRHLRHHLHAHRASTT